MSNEMVKDAALALKQGGVVVLPTETVYGLGVDAENEVAVARMYSIKGRPANHPVIVHICDFLEISYWATDIPKYASDLASKFWPGPMTLILKRTENAKDFVTGGQDYVGIRIPAHPVALGLLSEFKKLGGHGIAAPSANKFGGVSPTTSEHVIAEIGDQLSESDLVLDGGDSEIGVESTIIDCSRALPRILRLGAITEEMIREVTPIDPDNDLNEIRASGTLTRHYSPRAKVIVGRKANPGEGLIALAEVETPSEVVRLAAPESIEAYARQLYGALRKADANGLQVVVVEQPKGDGLAAAIRDRIARASAEN